jgi:hypothetical protein
MRRLKREYQRNALMRFIIRICPSVGLHIIGLAPVRHVQVGCKKLKLCRSLAHKVESERRLKRLSKDRRRLTS